MRIAIGAGHSPNCDGATGHGYSENAEARAICDAFERLADAWGVGCVRCDSSRYTDHGPSGYLEEQTAKFNSSGADVCLQVHLNSGGGTGCEVWRKRAGASMAARISANMANVLGLRDRGVKYSSGLYILNCVVLPVYIVEVCFIDRLADIEALQVRHEAVAEAILAAVLGEEVSDMQLSDKLNDQLLPDGSYNNVANVLDRTRRTTDAIAAKLDAMGDAGQIIDYDRLADAVADKLAARLSK